MRCVQDEKFGYIFNPWADGKFWYRNNNEGLTMQAMVEAARRELLEETSIKFDATRLIKEHNDWLSYQFGNPLEKDGDIYVGQRQKWFLLEYNGMPPDAAKTKDQEFRHFEWVEPVWLMRHTTKIKIVVYRDIFAAFGHYFP